ncbi:hypothetical protein ACFWN1_01825 [Streptomyces sp. NPDC058459]|uniref:hypothetical protein n=1 Tax=Streptomyces sp. NPDC058459 TaxID=3346508 RepID=UPI003664D1C8
MDTLLAQIAEAWNGPVSRATVGGRSLFAGMVRELKGDPRMHFDEVVREFPGVFDHTPIAQLGFNCYISLPKEGGELNVFRRRWRPADDEDRIGFGWSQTIVAREPRLTLTPELGEGIFAPEGCVSVLGMVFCAGSCEASARVAVRGVSAQHNTLGVALLRGPVTVVPPRW